MAPIHKAAELFTSSSPSGCVSAVPGLSVHCTQMCSALNAPAVAPVSLSGFLSAGDRLTGRVGGGGGGGDRTDVMHLSTEW